jgi:hypothetical protein
MVNIASRADSGQWQFSSAQNSAVHRTCVKQRGSRGKPEVATVSLVQGVFGGDQRTKTETEREQWNAGEFPKTLTPSVHQYHTCNSLYLSLNTFSLRPFLPSNLNRYRTHFFLSVQHCSFLEPVSQANILLWPNIANFTFYKFTSKSDNWLLLLRNLPLLLLLHGRSEKNSVTKDNYMKINFEHTKDKCIW